MKTINDGNISQELSFLGLYARKDSSGRSVYGIYHCSCGKNFLCHIGNVMKGKTKSCGCYRKRLLTTHGMSRTPEFRVWRDMIQRCNNPNHAFFDSYGGRGITVYQRWLGECGFANFYVDVGPRPLGTSREYSLERIDNDGPYGWMEKDGEKILNCRWATAWEQAQNRRPASHRDTSVLEYLKTPTEYSPF